MGEDMNTRNSILVVPALSKKDQGSKGLLDALTAPKKIGVEILKDHITSFVGSVNSLLSGIPAKEGTFKLNEIELTVEINAEGSIQLIGGIKTGASGGITLRLKR